MSKKLISVLFFVIIIMAGGIAYFSSKSQKIKSEIFEWKNFSWNGDALSFKYPAKFCWDDGDCRNFYIVKNADTILLGQEQKDSSTQSTYIDPIFSIYYIENLEQKGAEEYLKDVYELSDPISWISDGDNPNVSLADFGEQKMYAIYAAYSSDFKTLVSFQLGSACLLDCRIDGDILGSIMLNGVRVY